jgi:hypothetical protein
VPKDPIRERTDFVCGILRLRLRSTQNDRVRYILLTLSFRAECNAAEKSCDFSRIHSHVILERSEEVRGSTLYTTFLPLPCGQRFLHAANALVEMTKWGEYVPYFFVALKNDGTSDTRLGFIDPWDSSSYRRRSLTSAMPTLRMTKGGDTLCAVLLRLRSRMTAHGALTHLSSK